MFPRRSRFPRVFLVLSQFLGKHLRPLSNSFGNIRFYRHSGNGQFHLTAFGRSSLLKGPHDLRDSLGAGEFFIQERIAFMQEIVIPSGNTASRSGWEIRVIPLLKWNGRTAGRLQNC